MRNRYTRLGRYGLTGLAELVVLAGVFRSIVWGFVDFPCFATYNPDLDCIRDAYSDDAVGLRFEAYISVSELGWNGAGCSYTPSSSGETHLETSTGLMVVKEVVGGLEINGGLVAPATDYVVVDYLKLDPWVVGRTQLDYVGYVRNCGDAADLQAKIFC